MSMKKYTQEGAAIWGTKILVINSAYIPDEMPEVSGASEHSVYNAKLSLVRIYLFKYASAVLRQLGQLR